MDIEYSDGYIRLRCRFSEAKEKATAGKKEEKKNIYIVIREKNRDDERVKDKV